MNDAQKRQQEGSVLSVAVWRLAALCLSPLAAAIGCYFAIIGRIERVEIRSEYAQSELRAVESRIGTVRDRIDAHARSGPDGLPHPQGVISALASLDLRLEKMSEKFDVGLAAVVAQLRSDVERIDSRLRREDK